MRAFLKQILIDFYIYAGTRPLDKMSDEEVQKLLDVLENVCKLYDYITEEKQKEIILSCLVSDKDYQNMNARLLHKWFSENGKKYFKEEAHTPIEIKDVAPPEIADKYIEEFKRTLESIGKPDNPYKPPKVVELHESETLKSYYAGKTKFIVEGFEIWANTEEQAREIYMKNL